MSKAASVSFMSKDARLQMNFKSEKKGFNQFNQVEVIPWEPIVFVDGRFTTDDPEKIRFLRESEAVRHKRVIEVTEEDKQNISMTPPQPKTRGAVSSADLSKESGFKKEEAPGTRLQEVGSVFCDVPGCDYFAERDFRGNKIRMHKLAKHGIGRKKK